MAEAEAPAQQIRDLGPSWLEILEQQREACRGAWRAHRGRELKAESTSFSVVFATAEDAVAAAVEAQRSMRRVPVPDDARVGMRMGVHTGSPQRHEDGYVGLDVQKTSRLAAAAHAGQVLLSEATARLVGSDPDLQLLDLGEHRFQGRRRADPGSSRRCPRRPGVDLPQIRSQGTPGSLPKPLGPTVGRDEELAELRRLVLDDERRIVTLTGPGGTGKTRLATALAGSVAERFTDGVYLVPLQAATAADHVWTAMAQVLDIRRMGTSLPGSSAMSPGTGPRWWSWTTSSRCRTPTRWSTCCCARRSTSRSWRRRGAPCTSGARSSTPCRR